MSERLVLVDSSAWIAHLTCPHATVSRRLRLLLADHRVAVNPLVRLELLTGARDDAQYAELDDLFLGLHLLAFTDAVWRLAEQMRFRIRQEGWLIPSPDILMASCALVYRCELLHRDRHFSVIARHYPLTLHTRR